MVCATKISFIFFYFLLLFFLSFLLAWDFHSLNDFIWLGGRFSYLCFVSVIPCIVSFNFRFFSLLFFSFLSSCFAFISYHEISVFCYRWLFLLIFVGYQLNDHLLLHFFGPGISQLHLFLRVNTTLILSIS